MKRPRKIFYGEPLKKAVQDGKVPLAELDDHVRRILRSEFMSGIIDFPTKRSVVGRGRRICYRRGSMAEHTTVLLKNEKGYCRWMEQSTLHRDYRAHADTRHDFWRRFRAGGSSGNLGAQMAGARLVSDVANESGGCQSAGRKREV